MPTVREHELDESLPAFIKFVRPRGYKGKGTFASSCSGKKSFDSWKLAAEACGRRPRREVYRCRFCRMFHVGTKS